MATSRLNLTRDQLATFLKDHEQIRQFERLFADVNQLEPTTLLDLAINASTAGQQAVQALDALNRIANALELLACAPVIENNNSVVTDYVDLNVAPFGNKIRRFGWNSDDQTADLGMEYGVVQQIGLEYYARVQNNTGSTIANGTVVGFAGASTDNALSVAPYIADGSQPSLYIVGVMTHDLPDTGEKGYCTAWGYVRGINTTAFALGDVLYASPTVAGAFTNVKPTAPNNVIPIAAVLKVGASDGEIFVRPTIEQQRYYGDFNKTTDQSPAVISTAYALTFDNTRIANGVSIGSPASRIVVSKSGLYQFNATVQISSGNSSAKDVYVWFRKNGTDVPNSTRLVTIDVNNGYIPVALIEAFSLEANAYVELMFASTDTAITIDNVAATAFSPAAPAVVLSVVQVQQ